MVSLRLAHPWSASCRRRLSLPRAHGHRGHQLAVAADKGVVFDHSAELVRAIVVAGNGTGADVDAGTDGSIAHIGQVVSLRVRGNLAILDLDEVTHMGRLHRVRCPDAGGRMGRSGSCRPPPLLQYVVNALMLAPAPIRALISIAVRTDSRAFTRFQPCLQRRSHVDGHVAAASQFAAHVDARRVGQGDAFVQQAVGDRCAGRCVPVRPVGLCCSRPALPTVRQGGPIRLARLLHRHGDDIGQVVLALGVFVFLACPATVSAWRSGSP